MTALLAAVLLPSAGGMTPARVGEGVPLWLAVLALLVDPVGVARG